MFDKFKEKVEEFVYGDSEEVKRLKKEIEILTQICETHEKKEEILDSLYETVRDFWHEEMELVEDLEKYMRDNGLETPWVDKQISFYAWKEEQNK